MTTDGVFPSLSTKRLQLREIVASDAPAVLAIHSDREAMKWFGTDPLVDLEAAEKVIAGFANMRALPSPGVRWGIVHADPARGSALLGTCGVFRWNRGWRTCLTGYELARHAQGHGYMGEALRAIYAWAFETMAVDRIEAQVHPSNTPSLALLKTLGFVEEGLLREAGLWMGERRDLIQLGLLKREFVALAAPGRGDREIQKRTADERFLLADAAHDRGQHKEAFAAFLQLAEEGDLHGMTRVACMYADGEGTARSFEKSMSWDLKAAALGDGSAMFNLAITHRNVGNAREAKRWFEKCHLAGDGDASLELAKMYMVSELEGPRIRAYLVAAVRSSHICEASREEAQQLLGARDSGARQG